MERNVVGAAGSVQWLHPRRVTTPQPSRCSPPEEGKREAHGATAEGGDGPSRCGSRHATDIYLFFCFLIIFTLFQFNQTVKVRGGAVRAPPRPPPMPACPARTWTQEDLMHLIRPLEATEGRFVRPD